MQNSVDKNGKELEQTKEHVRFMADALPHIVWTTLPDGTLDYCNRRWYEYTDLTSEQTKPFVWKQLLHPDDLEVCVDIWEKSLATGENFENEYRLRRASDGAYRWHLGRAQPMRIDGEIILWIGTCTDIDDQKQTEKELIKKALTKSEKRFRSLVETMPSIVYEVEAEPPYAPIYLSPRVEELGYPLDKWLHDSNFWLSIVHPDDRERVEQTTLQARNVGQINEYEYRVIAADNSIHWIYDKGRFISDETNNVRWQGIMLDITARKNAEEELQNSEQQHRILFESNPQPVFVYDLETFAFLAVNESTVNHYGYSREELLTTVTVKDIRFPADLPNFLENMSQTIDGNIILAPSRHRKKDGSSLNVEITARNLFFMNRRAQMVLVNDVTERNRAEKLVRQSEEKYRNILETIEEGYYEVDLAIKFTFFNNALCEIIGYEASQIKNLSFRQYLDKPNAKKMLRAVREVYRTGEAAHNLDWEIVRRDGTRKSVESTVSLIRDEQGNPTGFRGFVRDVTRRKRVEAESQVISKIIEGISTTSNLEELLALIHQSIDTVLPAENCFVTLYNEKTGMLKMQFFADKYDSAPPPQKIGKGLSSYVFNKGRPVLLKREEILRLVENGDIELLGTPPAIWLGIPLRTPTEIIGMLVVQHYEDEKAYSPRDLEFLTSVGSQVAVAIKRKQMEEALALESSLMQALMDNIPDAIYFKDTQSRFLRVSRFAHLKEINSPEEAIGKTDFDFFDEQHARAAFEDEQRIVQTGEPIIDKVEEEIFLDGTTGWVLTSKVPIFDTEGKITGIVGASRDITEQKRIEEALKANELRMAEAQRIAHLGSWEYDAATDQVTWSDELWRIFGLEPRESGLPFDEFIKIVHPKDREIVKGVNEKAIQTDKNFSYDYRIIRPDGTIRVLHASGRVILNESGKIDKVTGTDQDITEQKRIEEELKSREAQLAEAQRIAKLGSWEWNIKTNQVAWSDECFRIFGLQPQEFGATYEAYLKAVHPDDQASVMETIEQTLKTNEYPSFEHRIVRPDGSVRILHADGKVVVDETGNPVVMLGIILDITERTLAEDKLRDSEAELRALFASMTDVILVLDKEGRYLKIAPTNPALLYKTPTELVGKTIGEVMPAEKADVFLKCINDSLEINQPVNLDYNLKIGDQEIWFAGTASPLTDETVLWVARNVTERKLMIDELEKTRDAALESVRLKSEFLANMSHEIRTPMNGVIGMTDLLLDTELSDGQREYTEAIQYSADALLTIIDDILDFSKIEAGQLRFEKIDFDLRDSVESSVELLAERAQSKEVELASLVYEDVTTYLRGDPGRVRQILTNLVSNAIKFTEKGNVAVSVEVQKQTGSHAILRFSITDTGIGISDDVKRRLFTPFTQADGSTTRKYGGTGLGLAISKQLVEMMGGEIGVESILGKGSTFWFTARFEKQPLRKNTQLPASAANLKGVRILVVDDNQTNRKIFVHQTASWGMIATEADSGRRALELLRLAASGGNPFEIAILDLMMPEMDGFTLAYAIKSDPAIAAVRLVLMPSWGTRGHGEMAREIGIAAYLQKPVRQMQLYNCLTAVVGERDSVENESAARLITQHTLREIAVQTKEKIAANRSDVRILLAEDNVVNQKVALSQLISLGYRADLALNGQEAVEAVSKNKYDVILMDCQMPVMDGFEATDTIRRLPSDAHQPVIIALTAHALQGEREKCLAAGMDDYISKPVKTDALGKMLARWTKQETESTEETVATPQAGDAFDLGELEILNLSILESFKEFQVPGEPDLVKELIDLFVKDTKKRLTVLHDAVMKKDEKAVKREAHALKGSAGNIGARRITAIVAEMENKADDFERIKFLFGKLETEFKQVVEKLDSMR